MACCPELPVRIDAAEKESVSGTITQLGADTKEVLAEE
jgi:hypothetical protein